MQWKLFTPSTIPTVFNYVLFEACIYYIQNIFFDAVVLHITPADRNTSDRKAFTSRIRQPETECSRKLIDECEMVSGFINHSDFNGENLILTV
jgi:hypothetical protein